MSPTRAGATVSDAPPPMPWNMRAARSELYDVVRPAHMDAKVMRSVATRSTGRRPAQFESGTQKIFDAPSQRTVTYQARQ